MAAGKKVRFIQFNGTLTEWTQAISTNEWADAVVFGYILDEQNNKVLNKIYAGKDTYNVDYIFDFDKDVCKWNYGNVSAGWHDASTQITNNIGQITTNMTIGDLINVTNGGELSRIIEMMLFANPGPKISVLQATLTAGSEKHSFSVAFRALNADECYMKIIDSNNKVILDSSISTSYDNVFNLVIPGMTYTVLANASSNNEVVSSSTQVTTMDAIEPTVSFNDISLVDNTSNNYYRITDISLNVVANDYDVSSASTWKINNDDYISYESLLVKDLSYGVDYSVTLHYNGKCIYQYPGESGTYINFDSDASTFRKGVPQAGDVSILIVNSSTINPSTNVSIYIDDSSFTVQYGIETRLRNAIVKLYIDSSNVSTLYNMTSGTHDFVYDMQERESGNYTINVSIGDEYGDYGKSNVVKINYTSPSSVEYLYTQLSHNSSVYYTEISDYIQVNGYNSITDVAGQSVANVITAVLDPTYNQGGDVPAGLLLDFIDRGKDVSYYEIRNDEAVEYGGKTYYKHVMSSYTNTALLMLIPDGYSAELWDSAMGGTAPLTLLTFTKSTNTITVNEKQYYVWYSDSWMTSSVSDGVYFFYVY